MSTDDPPVMADRQALGRAGFETGSNVYERARPAYPAEAVAHLEARAGITAASRVLDLAAGTGKLHPPAACRRGHLPGCRTFKLHA